MLSRTVWRWLAWSGTLLVVALCYAPAPDLPGPDVPNLDKLAHVVAFLGIGLAWRLSGLAPRRVLLLGLGLVLLTEVGQAVLPTGRTGDVVDAAADALGLVVGLWLAPRVAPWALREGRAR